MRILLTGASSFTGFWFARALVGRGHEVVATFRRFETEYDGLRGERVRLLAEVDRRFGVAFGDDRFLDLVAEQRFDALCHHAAEVTDYRSPDFDVAAAFAANTRRAADVLRRLEGGCLVLTGSVFEQNEGVGEAPLRAFGPYGLSKGLTAAAFEFYAEREGVPLGKFVIPNPFGPYEEPRFTAYLVRTWANGEVARVSTPAYVRDNIHVSLLAGAYAAFVEEISKRRNPSRLAPSGYAETQGQFAERFAAELAPRLGYECLLELAEQTDFPEPHARTNPDRVEKLVSGWSETTAWDEVADFYRERLR